VYIPKQYRNTFAGSPYLLIILALVDDPKHICQDLLLRDISSVGTYLQYVPGMGSQMIQWATKPLQCFIVLDYLACISTGKNGKNLKKYALDSPASQL
jgi:hypothetical protein